MLLLADNAPHSPVGIVRIPVIPWDYMYVAVHNALAGDPVHIKTNVVAIG